MSPLLELSTAVKARRSDMGLTQTRLASLSGLSRATVNQVESGTVKDLSMMRASRLLEALGLSVVITAPRIARHMSATAKSRPLDIAARTASVSYRVLLTADQLRSVLLKDDPAPDWRPHIHALLEEAPVSLLASVVEQLHAEEGMARAILWQRMRDLAHQLKSSRELWS